MKFRNNTPHISHIKRSVNIRIRRTCTLGRYYIFEEWTRKIWNRNDSFRESLANSTTSPPRLPFCKIFQTMRYYNLYEMNPKISFWRIVFKMNLDETKQYRITHDLTLPPDTIKKFSKQLRKRGVSKPVIRKIRVIFLAVESHAYGRVDRPRPIRNDPTYHDVKIAWIE